MNWAPCLAASWARCSCFWIIDSLSPVQLAWTSAPRTVRAISASPQRLCTSLGWWWSEGSAYTEADDAAGVLVREASGRRRM